MYEQWNQLKETIEEMRDNGGTCNQHEVCEFLVNYMVVLEKEMKTEFEKMREELDRVNALEHIIKLKGWDNYPEVMGK